jgi:hypothetical protein
LLSNVSNQKKLTPSTLEGHNQSMGGRGGGGIKICTPHWLNIKVDDHEYQKRKID